MALTRPPHEYIEIFLQPGEWYFGAHDTRLRTLLGSCVAITMWHPARQIGGMCHFLLPTRGPIHAPSLDGRYGDEALLWLFQEAVRHGTNPAEYVVKVFGGGQMFAHHTTSRLGDVGPRNVARAVELLHSCGFRITAQHVCDVGHRHIIFDVWSGAVWVKHVRPTDALQTGSV
ncbi:MAG: chemotaxis protein CheD [Candidatus Tectomicrobia bacterium]|uniref:Probable chemoreceptor glutamine deamidase CheD n=1 Tax=Tectimicrobiota bacterium TaxID=2528274 RepID=A0A937VXW0_UNCTE|nr:chemotaxis protein CheD [Candidatus Tectomicrobia bacterium]